MHLILLAHSIPENFPYFLKWMRTREYPIKGKFRDGVCRPLPTEIKLFDIRIKKEVVDEFLKDIKHWDSVGHIDKKKVDEFRKMLTEITPLEYVDMNKIKERPKNEQARLPGFMYLQVLGKIKDDEDDYGNEVL